MCRLLGAEAKYVHVQPVCLEPLASIHTTCYRVNQVIGFASASHQGGRHIPRSIAMSVQGDQGAGAAKRLGSPVLEALQEQFSAYGEKTTPGPWQIDNICKQL